MFVRFSGRIGIALVFFAFSVQFVLSEEKHPQQLYYLHQNIKTDDLRPGDEAQDLAELKRDRSHYFAIGLTCDQAKKYETLETVDAFFGDLLDQMSLCVEKRRALTELVTHVGDDVALTLLPLKKAFGRARPFVEHMSEIDRGGAPRCVHGKKESENASFPSLHAGISEAEALVLSEVLRDRAGDFKQRAGEIASGREALSVHYPSDVNAGAEVGRRVVTNLLTQKCQLGSAPCFAKDLMNLKAIKCANASVAPARSPAPAAETAR